MDGTIPGLHHVTAIAGGAPENLHFYTEVLGLRLVKRTVNFDAPDTYHLYYGDSAGRPGTLLTFFPFGPVRRGRAGPGMATEIAFAVPKGALPYWQGRLAEHDVKTTPGERFGESSLRFTDPDGMTLRLVEAGGAGPGEPEEPEDARQAPPPHAVRSFHSVALCLDDPEPTARLLTDLLGWDEVGEDDGRLRLRAPGGGRASALDLLAAPDGERGRGGAGTVHHIAFRASDEDDQQAWREELLGEGLRVTPVKDRQYFQSIYFREPGGVLFEIATDGPGFLIDEPKEALGTSLKLPDWLEPRRSEIERQLPPLPSPEETETT